MGPANGPVDGEVRDAQGSDSGRAPSTLAAIDDRCPGGWHPARRLPDARRAEPGRHAAVASARRVSPGRVIVYSFLDPEPAEQGVSREIIASERPRVQVFADKPGCPLALAEHQSQIGLVVVEVHAERGVPSCGPS